MSGIRMYRNAISALQPLKVVLSSPHHQHYRHIMLGEESLCIIEDIQAFYCALGYTEDMAKAGLLPDEFMWEEYVHKSGYSVCLQRHIMDYLHAHSPKFNETYGEQYEEFVEEHEKARIARGSLCAGCKLQENCKDAH